MVEAREGVLRMTPATPFANPGARGGRHGNGEEERQSITYLRYVTI
jgi:hypothetical protein